MNASLQWVLTAVLIGVGATVIMDLWALCLKRFFGIPSLNYAMVGRWLVYLPRGKLTHDNIGQAAPVAGETALGWIAHYLIGIAFAASLLGIMGLEWARQPTLLPPVLLGVLTLAAPFFVMQPGMGLGVAASRTPAPNTARLRSFMAHAAFGVGLYLTTLLVAMAYL